MLNRIIYIEPSKFGFTNMKKTIRKSHIPPEWTMKIKLVPSITRERAQQVINLFKQSHNKWFAQKFLICSFLSLTAKIAGRFYEEGSLDFDSLVAAGNRGLIKAANSYDTNANHSFLAFAVCHIRHEIKLEIQNNPLWLA